MHNAITGTTRNYYAYALDSSSVPVTGAAIYLYVENYTIGSWWNGSTWQSSRTYVTMLEDANISGMYYYPVLLPEAGNGIFFFADPITGTIDNGPWAEEAWVVISDISNTALLSSLNTFLLSNLSRLENYLKRIEQVVNQILNFVRRR